MNARYYSSSVGRFVSQDQLFYSPPLQYLIDPQQMNSYSYVANRPMVYTDPTGTIPDPTDAVVAAC